MVEGETEEDFKEVPTRDEFLGLMGNVHEIVGVVEQLGVMVNEQVHQMDGFMPHYSIMTINSNMVSRFLDSLVEYIAKKKGMEPVDFRILLMENAIKELEEDTKKDKWKGPMKRALEEADHTTLEALKIRLKGLRGYKEKNPKGPGPLIKQGGSA